MCTRACSRRSASGWGDVPSKRQRDGRGSRCQQALSCALCAQDRLLFQGFSLLNASNARNIKPPAMRMVVIFQALKTAKLLWKSLDRTGKSNSIGNGILGKPVDFRLSPARPCYFLVTSRITGSLRNAEKLSAGKLRL